MTPSPSRETAAEFLARMAKDPEWVAATTERRRVDEAAEAALAEVEQPIRDDLQAVGIDAGPWDLVNVATPYPEALPVIFSHLERGGYPDRVMEGLARAMAVRAAAPWWTRLRDLYERSKGPDERVGLASALAASASPSDYRQLVALVGNDRLGESRVFLLPAITRLGGSSARPVLELALKDDALAAEARHQLKRLGA